MRNFYRKHAGCSWKQHKLTENTEALTWDVVPKVSASFIWKGHNKDKIKTEIGVMNMPNVVPFAFLIKLTQKYGIAPSMSRRGNCYGNAMAENFFSILQTECICRHKPTSFHEANEMMDRYIHFYSYERIQLKTGVAPLTLRHSVSYNSYSDAFLCCPHNLEIFHASAFLMLSLIPQ